MDIGEDRGKLKDLQQTINNLSKWRDKVIAHIDQQFLISEKNISTEYPLKIDQFHEIISIIFHILNRYSGAYESSEYAEQYPNEDDIQFVMDCIRFKIEEHHKQIQAELEKYKTKT